MKFKVYHAKNPTFGFALPGQEMPKWPADFNHVANVEADGIEKVFELTNSIDCYWGENDNVETIGGPHRSTSVGDVVVLEDGKAMLCASCGWEEVKDA